MPSVRRVIKLLGGRLDEVRTLVRKRERQECPKRRQRKLDAGTTFCMLLAQTVLGLPSVLAMVAWLGDHARFGRVPRLDLPVASEAAITRALRRLEPSWLLEVMAGWVAELPAAVLRGLPQEVREVFRSGGSWFRATPKMTFAVWQDSTHRALKLVASVSRTGALRIVVAAGKASERALLLSQVRRGDLHVIDRGYPALSFFWSLHDKGVFFVARLSRAWDISRVLRQAEICEADRRRGILADQIVLVGAGQHAFTVRIVKFKDLSGRVYLFATNLLKLPATDIADLYHERWRVEILFRFVKQFVGARLTIRNQQAANSRLIAAFMVALLLLLLYRESASTAALEPTVRWLRRVRAAVEAMTFT